MRRGRQSFINRFMGDESDPEQEQQLQQEYSQILSHSQVRSGISNNNNQSFASQSNSNLIQINNQSQENDSPYYNADSNNLTNIFVGDNTQSQINGRTSSIGARSVLNINQQNNNFVNSRTSATNNNNNINNAIQRPQSVVDSSEFDRDDENDEDVQESQDWDDDDQSRVSQQNNGDRNFVETLVDDILARNHHYNQLQLAYNIASLQQQQNSILRHRTNSNEERNFGINPHLLRDTFDLIDRQREEESAADDESTTNGQQNNQITHTNSLTSSQIALYENQQQQMHSQNLYDYAETSSSRQREQEQQYSEDQQNEAESEHYYFEVDDQREADEEESSERETYRRFEQEEEDDDEDLQNNDQSHSHQRFRSHHRQSLSIRQEALRQASANLGLNLDDDQYDEDEEEEVTFGDEIEEADQNDENEDEDQDRYSECEDNPNDEETELDKYLRDVNGIARARTAPLKDQKHAEQYKMTPGFQQMEQAAVCAVQLVQRSDMKFDLDSYEGQNSCKKFLNHIEKLCDSLEVACSNRTYRKKFSNAYKVLYKEGKLCYLTEILDSAQEAFPYLWVNGEKYVFSKEVIDAGRNLFNNFCKILYLVKDSYQRVCEETTYEGIMDVMAEVKENLEEFDINWVTYEQLYVVELMLIESDARRFITEAIELEKEITSSEVRERAKGKIMVECPEYNKNRTKLVEIVNKINAVANPEGKGRDDLQSEILFQAEGICRRVSSSQSKAVRKLAEAIRKSLQSIRTLLRKYEENIEGVDPQLKNNADLVQALVEFEQSWEKGKTYFINPQKCTQLIHFTSMVEGTAEKYRSFQEQIDDRDTVIFVTIPALLILKNLDDDDKGICKLFFPPMFEENHKSPDNPQQNLAYTKFKDLRTDYDQFRAKSKNTYDFYNIVEKSVLEMEGEESSRLSDDLLIENNITRDDLQKIVQQIRLLAMQLQRHKPADWNEFLDVALDN